MSGAIATACNCGAVVLTIDVPKRGAGTRLACYCGDCRTGAALSGQLAEVLRADGGVDLYQTTPDRLSITRGAELLQIRRLGPNGLFRWYAGCCDTPMFNTLTKPSRPFVGVVLKGRDRDGADALLGVSDIAVNIPRSNSLPDAPEKDRGFFKAGFAILGRMLGAFVSGRVWRNPLVDTSRLPIAPIEIVEAEVLDRLRNS